VGYKKTATSTNKTKTKKNTQRQIYNCVVQIIEIYLTVNQLLKTLHIHIKYTLITEVSNDGILNLGLLGS
jgi:hypothetical protein